MKVCCEFSRKVQINQIQKKPLTIKIEADEKERLALSKRFSLPQLHSLTCIYQLKYFHGGQVRAVGEINALVTQNCVVSLDNFSTTVDESFELLFIPSDKITSELEEIDDPDVIPYENETIDLGEVTAEQLALLLDPYPHKENVDKSMILNEDNINSDHDQVVKNNPFKVLEQLKKNNFKKKK